MSAGDPAIGANFNDSVGRGILPTLARQLTPQARQEEVWRLPEARISNHRIHYSVTDDCVVVRPEDACNEACAEALARLVNSPFIDSENLIIDLSRTKYVETPGFRWLVRQFRHLESEGKVLIVAGLPPQVERTFKLLQLDRLIPLAKDVSEAMDTVQNRRSVVMA